MQQVTHENRDVAEINLDRTDGPALHAKRAVIGKVLDGLKMAFTEAAPRLLFVQERFD